MAETCGPENMILESDLMKMKCLMMRADIALILFFISPFGLNAQLDVYPLADTILIQDENGESLYERIYYIGEADYKWIKDLELDGGPGLDSILLRYYYLSFPMKHCGDKFISARNEYQATINGSVYDQNLALDKYVISRNVFKDSIEIKLYSKCTNEEVEIKSMAVESYLYGVRLGDNVYVSKTGKFYLSDDPFIYLASDVRTIFTLHNSSKVAMNDWHLGVPKNSERVIKID